MIYLYRWLISPLIALGLLILPLFHRKVREGMRLRRTHRWQALAGNGPVVWLHCASGEFEYAKPVIAELKTLQPNCQIVVTYFSPSVLSNIRNYQQVDQFGPMPFDTPRAWKHFFKTIKPTLGLIARTDLWPEMLAQTRTHGLPMILFSATTELQHRSLLSRWWKKWLFSYLEKKPLMRWKRPP